MYCANFVTSTQKGNCKCIPCKRLIIGLIENLYSPDWNPVRKKITKFTKTFRVDTTCEQYKTANVNNVYHDYTRMWANAQRDGRPAEYRWRPLFNAVHYKAAKTRNPLKFAGLPQTPEPISAASGPKFTILSGHVEEVLMFNIFSDCRYVP